MKADVLAASNEFSQKFAYNQLLTRRRQCICGKTITDVFPVIQDKKTALVLMGHGTEHYANTVYAALDYRFKDMGYENVIVATVEGYPEIDQALNQLEKSDAKKVVIAPFMIVAGDHAKNDMAGEEADSWKNVIGAKGYKVETVLKGLGEYESIRRLFVEHIKTAR
ncbi:MAG: sirohydrochlorin cobaltochelatase [Ruminococcus sp.]